jgi:hypothetical protein
MTACRDTFRVMLTSVSLALNILFSIWGGVLLVSDHALPQTDIYPWMISNVCCMGLFAILCLFLLKRLYSFDFGKKIQVFTLTWSLVQFVLLMWGGTIWVSTVGSVKTSQWVDIHHNASMMYLSFIVYTLLMELAIVLSFMMCITMGWCHCQSTYQTYSEL